MLLEFLYAIAHEYEKIETVLGVVIPIVLVQVQEEKKIRIGKLTITSNKAWFIYISISVLLIVNSYWMDDYTRVPNVLGGTYSAATDTLREAELVGSAQGSGTIVLDNLEVTFMSTQPGTIVKKGTVIYLRCFKTNLANMEDKEKSDDDTTNKTQELSLSIDEVVVFQDGFHYKFPDPENSQRTVLIDFTKGISGTFHYSRTLTESEKSNMGHGGKLYDENMNEISGGQYWSDTEGHFAMQFPEGLAPGTYVYELYQVIGDQFISSRVKFSF